MNSLEKAGVVVRDDADGHGVAFASYAEVFANLGAISTLRRFTANRKDIGDREVGQLKSLFRLSELSLKRAAMDGSAFADFPVLESLTKLDLRELTL